VGARVWIAVVHNQKRHGLPRAGRAAQAAEGVFAAEELDEEDEAVPEDDAAPDGAAAASEDPDDEAAALAGSLAGLAPEPDVSRPFSERLSLR
jgi:hypothetical protein